MRNCRIRRKRIKKTTSYSDMDELLSHTEKGEVFTWGWKECVPSQVKVTRILAPEETEGDVSVKLNSAPIEEVSPHPQGTNSALDPLSLTDGKSSAEETIKRRKTSSASRELDSPSPVDETLSVPPCIVALDPGVKITSVAAGGRHTLVLSGNRGFEDFGRYII